MNQMLSQDVAWVAGVFEGEGTFGIGTVKNGQGRKYHQVYLALHMTDKDVINRLQTLTGIGRSRPMIERPGRKQAFMWKVSKRQDVEDLIYAMLPFLGERRTERAQEAIRVIGILKDKAEERK